ncbi:MAG: hypothetical protein IT432_14840 [Phycisphaerales bacterium]|nr:hypothetical protein [Phycisphaerales bacterium]
MSPIVLPPGKRPLKVIRSLPDPADRVEEYAKLLEWLLACHMGDPEAAEAPAYLGTHVQRHADKFISVGDVQKAVDVCNRIKHTILDTAVPDLDQIVWAANCLDGAIVEALRYVGPAVREVVDEAPSFAALEEWRRRGMENHDAERRVSGVGVILYLYIHRMVAHPTRGASRAQLLEVFGFLLFPHSLGVWRVRDINRLSLESSGIGFAQDDGPILLPAGKKSLDLIRRQRSAADRVEDYGKLLEWLLVTFVSAKDLRQDLSAHVETNAKFFASLPRVYFGLGVYNDLKHAVSVRAPRDPQEISRAAINLEWAVLQVLPYVPWSVQRAVAVDGMWNQVRRTVMWCVVGVVGWFVMVSIAAWLNATRSSS